MTFLLAVTALTSVLLSLGSRAAAVAPPGCALPPAGLLSWWPADGNAKDIQGGNDGTLVGGTTFGPGKVGQAFNFDGTGEVVVADNSNLEVQTFTIAAWVFPTQIDGLIDIIVNKEPPEGWTVLGQYEIGIRGSAGGPPGTIPQGNLAFSFGGGQIAGLPNEFSGWVDAGAPAPLNTWTHVALTFNGSTVKAYVNGEPTRIVSGLSGTIGTSSGPLKIGSRGDVAVEQYPLEPFNGRIDEVQVYNRALTAAEVQISFAGECEKIAFQSNRDGNWEIYVMNADGGGQTNLTNEAASDIFAAWSPDDSKIAFVSDRDGDFEVYVMNADGSGQTNLTNNPALDYAPAWSPDGSKIAFRSDRDGNPEVYVMAADGGGQTRLTNDPAMDTRPAWSPDGSKIAFYSGRDGNWEVYVMNAGGGAQTNLTNNQAQDSDPAWSPDGSKIAFNSDRDSNWEIYVMDAAGGAQTNLTNDAARDVWPAWSPDGSRIAFDSDRDGNREVYVMDAGGGAQTRLTNNSSDDQFADWQSISMKQPTNYRALAEYWAPVIYQDTDSSDADADFITKFDFDGDFDGTNNWDNQDNLALSLDAYVYYWVVETPTNWFIGYAFFHPRDWTEVCTPEWFPGPPTCHENDMEAILLTIARDGSSFGEFLLMNTVWHNFYRHYNSSTSPATGSFEGEVQFGGSYPIIYATSGGHAIVGIDPWTNEANEFPRNDGVVYSFTGNAKEPISANDRQAGYDLLTIQELWERRCEPDGVDATFGDELTFVGPAFRGDDWGTNAANAPWGFGTSGVSSFLGYSAPAFFSNPAEPIFWNFANLGPFSLTYTGSSYAPGPADSQTTGCVQESVGNIVWLSYDNVTVAGETTLTTSETGPPAPSGYQPGNVPLYFGLTTTSTFTGEVDVCANYDETNYTSESSLGLFHWNGSLWSNVTTLIDNENDRACGRVTSFSPFLIAELIPTDDFDGDGCSNAAELDAVLGSEATGGLRDPLNPWDFYDVDGLSGPDGYIDLLFDILGVIQHYSPQGAPPYDVAFDRGPSAGPNPWNMTAPDGVIDLLNDILGVILQHSHDCR